MQKNSIGVRALTLSFRRDMCAANDSGGNRRAGIANGKLNYDLVSLGLTYRFR